jgi:COP9 signalosome complex subunit 3
VLLLGEKRFPEAMDFLLLAVTTPALALSAFAIEAYKKLLLAALLGDGEAASLPKYTPFVVSRHLESHCLPYTDLVRAFVVKRDVTAARGVVERHAAVFTKDGNLGLVRQCLVALQHRKLLQLTRTYATIELAEMPHAAGIAGTNAGEDEAAAGAGADAGAATPPVSSTDVEKMLLQLIASGQMDAVIDRQKAKVTFVLEDEAAGKDELDSGGDAEMMRRLQREMQKLVFVASRLRDMDAELVTSAKFQGKLAKEKDRRQRLAMHNQQSDEGMEDAAIGAGMDTSE